jgi:thiamine monophosphate kinase
MDKTAADNEKGRRGFHTALRIAESSGGHFALIFCAAPMPPARIANHLKR